MRNSKKCNCDTRGETSINSHALFLELKAFFGENVRLGIYKEIPVKKPFYIGYSKYDSIKWYATKWYKCKKCGCLWEFNYPDFPAKGFVRKFEDGKYYPRQ